MSNDIDTTERCTITDLNRVFVIEWLVDRSAFHVWFSSLITGSFVVITFFGDRPDVSSASGKVFVLAVLLFLFSLLCNLVCVWSIPTWKYRINTGVLSNQKKMRRELSITAWLGVISFVSGLTLSMFTHLVV